MVKVIKDRLKQGDAVKKLVKRAVATIESRHLTTSPDEAVACPPTLVTAMEPFTSKLTQVRQTLLQNENILQPLVEKLNDEHLTDLLGVFDVRGGQTEDRLFACVNILLKDYMLFLRRP